jgi:hypothetical protein
VLALPGALTVYFGFSGGGFFPAQTAVGAVFLALVLVVRVTMAEHPFAGLGAGVGVAAGALSLYALWTLLSSSWSHATGRALIEFDRALMYALALILFGSIAQTAASAVSASGADVEYPSNHCPASGTGSCLRGGSAAICGLA